MGGHRLACDSSTLSLPFTSNSSTSPFSPSHSLPFLLSSAFVVANTACLGPKDPWRRLVIDLPSTRLTKYPRKTVLPAQLPYRARSRQKGLIVPSAILEDISSFNSLARAQPSDLSSVLSFHSSAAKDISHNSCQKRSIHDHVCKKRVRTGQQEARVRCHKFDWYTARSFSKASG